MGGTVWRSEKKDYDTPKKSYVSIGKTLYFTIYTQQKVKMFQKSTIYL